MRKGSFRVPAVSRNDDVTRYKNFYSRRGQTGGMPVFSGRRRQRGHGIGNVLGSLLRRVVGFVGSRGLDFIKQNRQAAVKNVIRTGLDIAKDVTGGKKVKEALRTRIPQGIKQTASELQFQLGNKKPREQQQQRKRKRRPAAAAAVVSKKKKKKKDIFS